MKRYLLLSLSVCAIFILSGCASRPDGKLIFSEPINGCTVSMENGEEFELQLKENPTTGYIWTVDKLESSMLSVSKVDYKADNSQLLGSGGVRTIRIKTLNPGQTKIRLLMVRPWEKGVVPAKVFELDLKIKPN